MLAVLRQIAHALSTCHWLQQFVATVRDRTIILAHRKETNTSAHKKATTLVSSRMSKEFAAVPTSPDELEV